MHYPSITFLTIAEDLIEPGFLYQILYSYLLTILWKRQLYAQNNYSLCVPLPADLGYPIYGL